MDPSRLGGLSVLLVEDDPDAQATTGALLRAAGARVTITRTVAEAFDIFRAGHRDVVVCDLRLPGRPGHELARAIRALAPAPGSDCPILALTAFGTEESQEAALSSGFTAYMVKPAFDTLIENIARLCGREAVRGAAGPAGQAHSLPLGARSR